MRILITGVKGRLGQALLQQFAETDYDVSGFDVDTVDITHIDQVTEAVQTVSPDIVIHCAALTAVDYCAEHPEEALRVNGIGTQYVAVACQQANSALLYVSTNEVFDGFSGKPYLEYDRPNPANPYGYSKWVGEQVIRDLVPRHFIVRTSWLFAHGGTNFIHAILKRAREGHPLRVVTNEVSTPTYTNDLAEGIIQLIQTGCFGIYHLVNEGSASRYHFAREVLDVAGFTETTIEPIALAQYPRTSRPPQYAVLKNTAAAQLGIKLRHWKEAVRAFIERERAREQEQHDH